MEGEELWTQARPGLHHVLSPDFTAGSCSLRAPLKNALISKVFARKADIALELVTQGHVEERMEQRCQELCGNSPWSGPAALGSQPACISLPAEAPGHAGQGPTAVGLTR